MDKAGDVNIGEQEFVDRFYYEGGRLLASPSIGEEIVISGISGTFPNSRNVKEFSENLFNKVDMMQKDKHWGHLHSEIPSTSGMLPDVSSYDGGFFGVHERQSNSMDPLARIFQEKALESVFDAGLHPSELEGSKTGVYVGISTSEYDKVLINETNLRRNIFGMTGTERSMIANRLSYFLKLKGPSYIVDTACSSSFFVLEEAYRGIRLGEIDRAIVGGLNLCLHPLTTLQFARINIVSKAGTCKPFDHEGQGFVRSEAAVVLILQKFKDARRTYAQIVHIKTNCDGFKEQGINCPSTIDQMKLIMDTHRDCDVDRSKLAYIEAHGTGTKIGDPLECKSIDGVLTTGRKTPLLMGSVKSNMGHAEAASGLCSVIKCILAMETGYIPPNINFNKPRKDIAAILEERIKIVTGATPLEDDNSVIGINNFGFGGTNAYLILKRNSKKKITGQDDLPRLGLVSGRTKEGVQVLLAEIQRNAKNHEYLGLLREVFKQNIPNHLYRGYSIASQCGNISNSTVLYPVDVRPLYFVFGHLKNWHNIGKQLMVLPIFSDAIKRLQQSTNLNITDIFVDGTSRIGSLMLLLALEDVLKQLDIHAKGIFGSFGGILVSSYCNGILTLDEVINTAIVLEKITSDDEELQDLFVLEMSKMSLNSNKLQKIKKSLRKSLNKKCIDCLLDALLANRYTDIENIQMNSTVLEISDNSLGPLEGISVISLFSHEPKDHIVEFLEGLGRLYLQGFNPKISTLYPGVDFPVSRGTPMISPCIRWNHSRKKFVPLYDLDLIHKKQKGIKKCRIELNSEKWAFISGHVIDIDRCIFPISGYLYLVWETFVLMNGTTFDMSCISIEKCEIFKTCTIPTDDTIIFVVFINKRTGDFKVTEGISTVITGTISFVPHTRQNTNHLESSKLHDLYLNKEDVYKELRLRGLNYSGKFRAIEKYNHKNCKGYIQWRENWVTFIDNLVQMKILESDTRLLRQPTFISKLEIDAISHQAVVKENQLSSTLPAYNCRVTGKIRCGGVTISGIVFGPLSRKKRAWKPLLESHEFVPNCTDLETQISVRVNIQIVLENTLVHKLKVVELIDEFSEKSKQPLTPLVSDVLKDEPLIQSSVKILSKEGLNVDEEVANTNLEDETNCHLVIASKILSRPEILILVLETLQDDGFIISRENYNYDINTHTFQEIVSIVTLHRTSSETLLLLKKVPTQKPRCFIKIESSETSSWLSEVQRAVKKASIEDLILYSDRDTTSGILGMVNCLRKEPDKNNIKCVFIMDENEGFDPKCCTFQDQLDKNMAFNVFKDGQWGTYRHLVLEKFDTIEREHCFGNVVESGDVTTVKWTEGPLKHFLVPKEDQELVYVNYSSLNCNMDDIKNVNKKICPDLVTLSRLEVCSTLGCEFSGRNKRGNRIMGISPKETLSNLILVDPLFVHEVPSSWTLEEAATVPMSYTFIIYALVIRGHLKTGDKVLVHTDDKGIEEAAIRLAVHYGCEVLTTSNKTQTEGEYFTKTYLKLKDNIFNFYDENFDSIVLQKTNGRGVDLVVNYSTKNSSESLLRCLAKGGQLLNLRVQNATHNFFNLLFRDKELSVLDIVFEDLFQENFTVKSKIRTVFQDLLQNEVIIPLNKKVFEYGELEKAYRYASDEKNSEKVLIQIRELESQRVVAPKVQKLQGTMRYYCDPRGVYIIIGGLGGLGLELADWLILRGCKKLSLSSRRGVTTGYQNYRISLWESYGVKIKIHVNSLVTKEDCKQIIEETKDLGPILAFFNLAVVLVDAPLENQTEESFAKCLGPKVSITKHLDELTRTMCPKLRDFVVFSSVCCGRGNAEQSNYGMANSVMERICEKRKRDGYPGLAIQWGMIGEVGIISELKKDRNSDVVAGLLQQPIVSCLEVLDILLSQNKYPVVTSMVVAEKRSIQSTNNMVASVASIIGLKDLKYISVNSTLPELGMDSMLSKEIKQVLEKDFGKTVDMWELRSMTIKRLKEIQEEIQR